MCISSLKVVIIDIERKKQTLFTKAPHQQDHLHIQTQRESQRQRDGELLQKLGLQDALAKVANRETEEICPLELLAPRICVPTEE
jgi:hypothetical protein